MEIMYEGVSVARRIGRFIRAPLPALWEEAPDEGRWPAKLLFGQEPDGLITRTGSIVDLLHVGLMGHTASI